jgi:glycine oxidase
MRQGVEIREYTPVTAITYDRDRVTGVTVGHGEVITSPIVINAAGSWATQLGPSMSRLPVKPIKGTIVLLETAAPLIRELLDSSQGALYPRPDNKLLLGATLEDVGFDKRVTLKSVDQLVHQAVTLMPCLKDATWVTAWSGLRPYTHDNLPYLGQVPGWRGAYVATGHFRNGILLAPVTGLLMKEIILDQAPTLPLEPYDIGRVF